MCFAVSAMYLEVIFASFSEEECKLISLYFALSAGIV